MLNIGRYVLGGMLVGLGIYVMLSGKSRLEVLKKLGDDRARDVTIGAFLGMFKGGKTSIEEMILEFENSEGEDLESFAKKRGRTAGNYIQSYGGYYKEAKKIYEGGI